MSDLGGTFDPLADTGPERTSTLDLGRFLLELGASDEDVAQATADGTLELLAIEKLANLDPPVYDVDEVASLSGISAPQIRAYWRALGFPDPRPGEKLFSDRDLAILSDVVWFIADGALEPGMALQMARVIGSSLERVASAQVDAIETRRVERTQRIGSTASGEPATDGPADSGVAGEPDAGPGPWGSPGSSGPSGSSGPPGSSEVDAHLAIRRGAELLPIMPKVMEQAWRRHLSEAARRRRLRTLTGMGDRLCVGFADLVGFTAQTQQLDEEELADVVNRFESIAYDVVGAHGGRVVKMIGDEVMFVTDEVSAGAGLALALAETYRDDDALSDVRVGLASGPVLEREGDVYGPVVNLASRIVSIAYPGAVVVGEDIHRALGDDGRFQFKSIRSHYLKDIGRVRLYSMRRAGDRAAQPYPEARARDAARRQFQLARRAAHLAAARPLPTEVEGEVAGILEDAGLVAAGGATGTEPIWTGEEPTQEILAITDVVLEADIDEEVQVELLADIEVARRLAQLEREAQRKAEEADLEAEAGLEAIEREVRDRILHIELEARRRIDEALADAERRAEQVNEEASRKVKRVAAEAERKADQVTREARRVARRKTAKRRAARKLGRRHGDRSDTEGPDTEGSGADGLGADGASSDRPDREGWETGAEGAGADRSDPDPPSSVS